MLFRSATNQTLYIDGVQEDQDAKGTATGTKTSISIGNSGGADQSYSNQKNFRIYDVELTPDQAKRT